MSILIFDQATYVVGLDISSLNLIIGQPSRGTTALTTPMTLFREANV